MTISSVESQVFSGYSTKTSARTIAAGGIAVRYDKASATSSVTSGTVSDPSITLDLMPLLKGSILPGSLRFKYGNLTYVDRAGVLYHSVATSTGSGTACGTVNYATGEVKITAWSGDNTFTLEAGCINPGATGMSHVVGRTSARPIKAQSFTLSATALDGTAISVTADADGKLNSAHTQGYIDLETGIYAVAFGATVSGSWNSLLVDPSTMHYNAVAYSYLPLDASLIGLDPVRLPQDGRVPVFREGDFAVIGNTATLAPQTVSNGQTVNCGRVRLSRVRVINNNGAVINTGYSQDLEAGTVTFTDVSTYSQPIAIEHRIEDMVQVSDVQINGQLTFTRPVTHAYPTGSIVSSALVSGDLHARTSNVFDQATWTNAWSDTMIGSAATGTYNTVLAPIVVTNDGAVTERWAIVFTNTTAFYVMGEHVGVIATGSTAVDMAPVNAATSKPYFTLKATGWGSGWAAGNVLRFNTVGAMFPFWTVRTIQQGLETVANDSFTLLVRGDVDA